MTPDKKEWKEQVRYCIQKGDTKNAIIIMLDKVNKWYEPFLYYFALHISSRFHFAKRQYENGVWKEDLYIREITKINYAIIQALPLRSALQHDVYKFTGFLGVVVFFLCLWVYMNPANGILTATPYYKESINSVIIYFYKLDNDRLEYEFSYKIKDTIDYLLRNSLVIGKKNDMMPLDPKFIGINPISMKYEQTFTIPLSLKGTYILEIPVNQKPKKGLKYIIKDNLKIQPLGQNVVSNIKQFRFYHYIFLFNKQVYAYFLCLIGGVFAVKSALQFKYFFK